MSLLMNRIQPKDGESLYSYINRCALANHFDHIGSMLKEIAPQLYVSNCNYLVQKQKWVPVIMDFLKWCNYPESDNIVLNRFNTLLFEKEPNRIQSDRLYFKYNVKYCPCCIKDDYYHRLSWDVKLVTVCTKHGQMLIDRCPECHEKIYMSRFVRGECSCGFKFIDTKKSKRKISDSIFSAQYLIQGLLNGEIIEITRVDYTILTPKEYFNILLLFCEVLDNLSPGLFDLGFGKVSFKAFNFLMNNNTEDLTVEMMTCLTTLAHQLVIDPMLSLSSLLCGLDLYKKFSNEGYMTKLRKMKKIVGHAKGALYQQEAKNYFLELKELTSKRSLVKIKPSEQKYIGLGEAKKMLKIDYDSVKKLAEIGAFKVHKANGNGKPLVERKSLEKFIETRRNCITLDELMHQLEITYEPAIKLVTEEIIHPIHGPGKDGHSEWMIKKNEIGAFQNNYFRKLEVVDFKNDEWIPLKNAVLKLANYDVDTVVLIRLIKDRVIRAGVTEGRYTFKGLRFYKPDLDRLKEENKRKRQMEIGFIPKEIATLCRVGPPKIEKLIKEGKLTITHEKKDPHGYILRYIDGQQVDHLLNEIRKYGKKKVFN